MTMDVAMGLVPAVPARGNERGGSRMEKGETPAFDDALTQKPTRRMPPARDRTEQADDQAPRWLLGGYGDRLALSMPFTPAPDPASEGPAAFGLPVVDAEAHDPAVQGDDDARDAADAPDATLRMQPDDEPASAGPAIAAGADERQPATKNETAPRADANDANDALNEDAPRPQAKAGSPEGTPPANAQSRMAAPPVVVAASGEPAPPERRGAPARETERRSGTQAAPAARTVDAPAVQERRPALLEGQPNEPARPTTARPTTARPTTARVIAERGGLADGGPRTGADGGQPRVGVLGFSTSAPPVMPAAVSQPAVLSQTAAGVVAAMEAEPTWRAAAAETAGQRSQQAGTVSTLRIQLNPAELGLVTARLVATGTQLEIEIRVESNDARQRLSSDADTIVKALRGIGYDIERVTIQQAQPGTAASQQQGGSQRDSFMQGQQGEAGTHAGRGGQGEKSDANTARGTSGEMAAERAGGGVYI